MRRHEFYRTIRAIVDGVEAHVNFWAEYSPTPPDGKSMEWIRHINRVTDAKTGEEIPVPDYSTAEFDVDEAMDRYIAQWEREWVTERDYDY